MSCENCQCGKSTHQMQQLFDRLAGAKFSGTLHLRFEAGAIASAELRHYLSNKEFTKTLPTIEKEMV
jgi:hypothetical protein